MSKPIGVLALQGGFAAHVKMLNSLGFNPIEVRRPSDLAACRGLVLPGGESSAQLRLLENAQLEPALQAFAREGHPILATCAGLILAARAVSHPEQPSFGWLDIDVARNAWGRQRASFEARDDGDRYDLVFIRAPRITRVGARVEVLATLDKEPIWVRSGAVFGTTFHPELAGISAIHQAAFGDR